MILPGKHLIHQEMDVNECFVQQDEDGRTMHHALNLKVVIHLEIPLKMLLTISVKPLIYILY